MSTTVTRNELKLGVLNHFESLSCEPALEGVEYIDIDGLGLKVLNALNVTKTFTGAPIKQFDRLYQFGIKYSISGLESLTLDSSFIKESDVEKILDICTKKGLGVDIVDNNKESVSLAPYSKRLSLIASVQFIEEVRDMGAVMSGTSILWSYNLLRDVYQKTPHIFARLAATILGLDKFSPSFKKMTREFTPPAPRKLF